MTPGEIETINSLVKEFGPAIQAGAMAAGVAGGSAVMAIGKSLFGVAKSLKECAEANEEAAHQRKLTQDAIALLQANDSRQDATLTAQNASLARIELKLGTAPAVGPEGGAPIAIKP